MAQFGHVAKILPGQKEALLATVKGGFEAAAPALKSAGLTRITCFHSPEADSGDGGLLVVIYEADNASVICSAIAAPLAGSSQ